MALHEAEAQEGEERLLPVLGVELAAEVVGQEVRDAVLDLAHAPQPAGLVQALVEPVRVEEVPLVVAAAAVAAAAAFASAAALAAAAPVPAAAAAPTATAAAAATSTHDLVFVFVAQYFEFHVCLYEKDFRIPPQSPHRHSSADTPFFIGIAYALKLRPASERASGNERLKVRPSVGLRL